MKRVRTTTSFATRASISVPAFTGGDSVGLFESVKECFCRLQIGGLEPFGETVVDRPEKRHRFRGTVLIAPQSGEAGGDAQFPRKESCRGYTPLALPIS
jgi:hypothetical protein